MNSSQEQFPTDRYPQQFVQYVVRSVTVTLESISYAVAALGEEERNRIMHILSFALTSEKAWPEARKLLLQSAPIMEKAGLRDEWIGFLERGVSISRQQDDQQTEAELCLYIGELLRLRSNFELARQWLSASIAIFSARDFHQGQARGLNELAFVAWQQHHYDEAEELAQRALMLLDENDPERATCFSRLGLVAIDRQKWEDAEEYHRDALQIRQAEGARRKIAWSLQNLGYVLRGQGKYEDSVRYYEQAIAILGELQDIVNQAVSQMNLAITYDLCNDQEKALKFYNLAEVVFRELHDQYYLAKIFINKGLSYLAMQDLAQAEQAFLVSADLFQKLGDVGEKLNAMDGLGLVYLKQDKHELARIHFASILEQLPQIVGTPLHDYLAQVVPTHIALANAGNS